MPKSKLIDNSIDDDDDKNEDSTPKKVIFAPNCFDEFEGTQEELDSLIAHITQLAESGELEANLDEVSDDVINDLRELIDQKSSLDNKRTVH
jgi:hypothetical protein